MDKEHLKVRPTLGLGGPKSVLDAMAQVSECEETFESSTDVDKLIRLMIVVTETSSKRAGHGDIIGLFHPSDGQCKIRAEDNVTSADMDYIHPHMLGQSLSKNNIRVLILTNSTKIKHYKVCNFQFFGKVDP
ncbi:Integrin beta-2 [Thelohanellus kitauei]|uniref:Integrin beta-2 n=1 Tax=Thelohanellus kitauei TaxID=669202 RepID=A0A0C2N444_THEKT|nr:Integrin beta-2 [Thelohanellus kitauei]